MPDHAHMMISIPPKYAVSQVIEYIKGKSAIHLARVYGERKRNFVGNTLGREDSSCPRWGEMTPSCARISGTRSKRKSDWIKWGFGSGHRRVAPERRGRVSNPNSRFERLTNQSPRLCRGDKLLRRLTRFRAKSSRNARSESIMWAIRSLSCSK